MSPLRLKRPGEVFCFEDTGAFQKEAGSRLSLADHSGEKFITDLFGNTCGIDFSEF